MLRLRSAPFTLDSTALAKARASSLLAIDPGLFGSVLTLPAVAPSNGGAADSSSIAVVEIMGPLAQRADAGLCGYLDGYDAIAARFAEAVATKPSAIVLHVDGPGGDVAGGEEAIAAMCAMRGSIPVYASIDERAASMTFWLASCVANAGVFLPAAGECGSIGVLSALQSKSKQLTADGIDVEIIRDPPGKALGNGLEPICDESRARAQERVTAAANRFYAAVGSARGMDPAAVRGLNGKMFTGADAVAAGLADGVLNFAQVCALAAIQSENQMALPKSVAVLLGVAETANPLEIEQAVLTHNAASGVIAKLGALTGETNPEKAIGLVAAWKESHATHAAASVARDSAERDSLVVELVTLGAVTPGEAWADASVAADTAKRKPAPMFAVQSLDVLRGYVAGKRQIAKAAPAFAEKKESAVSIEQGASEDDLETAKRLGVSLKSYLEAKKEQSK